MEKNNIARKTFDETRLNPQTLSLDTVRIVVFYEQILKEGEVQKIPISRDTQLLKKIPLSPVTLEEIAILRQRLDSGLIYKNESAYYYVQIPSNLKISGYLLGRHTCSSAGVDCARIYALPESQGGCSRVLNRDPKIECFPWIRRGFQTIHCSENSFFIAKCDHYEKDERKKPRYSGNATKLKRDLYDLFYD